MAFDIASGDINRDGIPDLVVANADAGSLSLLLGRGDGRFSRIDFPIGKYSSPRDVTIADMNGDGVPDVIFTAYQSNYLHVMLGDGAGGGVQQLQIYTREDGVSIDQIVLSAQKYLTARPGAAKNDHTILGR